MKQILTQEGLKKKMTNELSQNWAVVWSDFREKHTIVNKQAFLSARGGDEKWWDLLQGVKFGSKEEATVFLISQLEQNVAKATSDLDLAASTLEIRKAALERAQANLAKLREGS